MIPALTDYSNYSLIDGPLSVENMKVLQGANYYSGGPVVLIRLNLCKFDEVFTNQIDGFYEKLASAIPTLQEHHCSEAKKGGFFIKVKEGTLLGHVIEHVAIELQTLAGMDVGFGKTRSTLRQGVYNIIFRFIDEKAGIYAGKAAVNLINSLLLNLPFDIVQIIDNLIDIREANLLGPSTQAIVDEAAKRKIPFMRLDTYNLVQLGTGRYHKRIRNTITSDTNLIAVETADNKYLTTLMLKDAGIPVLETIKTNKLEDVFAFHEKLKVPIVIKPTEGYLGKNMRLSLSKKQDIEDAFHYAMQFNKEVIAQPFFIGNTYRLLIINYKFVAAVEQIPPFISGNNKDTIEQLIQKINEDPIRKEGDNANLSKVVIDDIIMDVITQKGYNLSSVLLDEEVLYLSNSGNMRLGSSAIDVTDNVHPFTIYLAERAAVTINLNVAGIDIITDDIGKSLKKSPGYFLEVNASPDFRMHLFPAIGKKRDVASQFVEMLFPAKVNSKIPVFSITGSYGKTTTVNFLGFCLKQEGYNVGITSSNGLFINDVQLKKEDSTFALHAALLLKDNTIDCAIFETSCEGILRNGLGYQYADYGVILSLNKEHLGKDDIKKIEDIAYAKSLVIEQVYDEGFAILNADNELIMEMKDRAYGTAVLFSEKEDNPAIISHTFRGGMAVYIKKEHIFLHNRGIAKSIIPIDEIPLITNDPDNPLFIAVLAVCSILYAHNVNEESIVQYLKSYQQTTSI